MADHRSFSPLRVAGQNSAADADRVVVDMLNYPAEEESAPTGNGNASLRIDETVELLLSSLRRNEELGFDLTGRQISLLAEVCQLVRRKVTAQEERDARERNE